MSASDLLFDTWAWWEVLHGTRVGRSLRTRFLLDGKHRIHTSAISLAEVSARLASDGAPGRIEATCGAIRRESRIWDVTADIAVDAGRARGELPRTLRSASLADAVILVTARRAGAVLVSGDPAFAGVPGVIRG